MGYSSKRAYRRALRAALDDRFLGETLARFASNFRKVHDQAFAGQDYPSLTRAVGRVKAEALESLEALYHQFVARAEEAGAHVHLAHTAEEANHIIAEIARDAGVRKIVKSKSMTTEEIFLNRHLENAGHQVTETDLGEWIIQLKQERPSHMTIPAIHLSRHQVADLFAQVEGTPLDPDDVTGLVEVARRRLRQAFLEADMGITGANLAIAETGTLVLLANEGNIRLVTTLPPVHVALVGLEKLIPNVDAARTILEVLPRNVGGQRISSYVTWITGANQCAAGPDGRKAFHIVFLDNGRSKIAHHPVLSQALRCVRCGACANVCPVYTAVGGHRHGHIYVGAIGLVLTWLYHGSAEAQYLVDNCTNCLACRTICSAGIDLPALIAEVRGRVRREVSSPDSVESVPSLARVIKDRRLFHRVLRIASRAQGPFVQEGMLVRHLPHFFRATDRVRGLPAIVRHPFRERWLRIRPQAAGRSRLRVALFAGCLVDFVYPHLGETLVKLLSRAGVSVLFPEDQGCCGLPVAMMSEPVLAAEVARQNVTAFEQAGADHVVTACASCASHLKTYPALLCGHPDEAAAREFANRVWDISSFLYHVLNWRPSRSPDSTARVAYHAPCHLCRGLAETRAPKALLQQAGHDVVDLDNEQVCCGFGGSYSWAFPEVSRAILDRKLDPVAASGATHLATDCPGCILQLRRGARLRGDPVETHHVIELLEEPGPTVAGTNHLAGRSDPT